MKLSNKYKKHYNNEVVLIKSLKNVVINTKSIIKDVIKSKKANELKPINTKLLLT